MVRWIGIILAGLLVAVYVVVVLIPEFAQAGGLPGNFVSLTWPLALIVFGLLAMFGGSAFARKQAAKKVAEGKNE